MPISVLVFAAFAVCIFKKSEAKRRNAITAEWCAVRMFVNAETFRGNLAAHEREELARMCRLADARYRELVGPIPDGIPACEDIIRAAMQNVILG